MYHLHLWAEECLLHNRAVVWFCFFFMIALLSYFILVAGSGRFEEALNLCVFCFRHLYFLSFFLCVFSVSYICTFFLCVCLITSVFRWETPELQQRLCVTVEGQISGASKPGLRFCLPVGLLEWTSIYFQYNHQDKYSYFPVVVEPAK